MTLKTSNLERVLAAMLISDRLWIKTIYESTAEVVMADGKASAPMIATLGDWLKLHNSIKNFIWSGISTACPIVYPELIDAIDRHIAASLESCDGNVTPVVRARLVAALDHIAWAGLGGDE